jgi:hypothetical protein
MWIGTQSKLIGSVLSPAVKLWLRSQLEEIAHLDLTIAGCDRQLIGGYLPMVYLKGQRALYQGLHLEQVEMWAENTRINIGQILKGKPLQLLEPIGVTAQAQIQESDLNRSLSSFILSNALNDLLIFLLQAGEVKEAKQMVKESTIAWRSLTLDHQIASVEGIFSHPEQEPIGIRIRLALALLDARTLEIKPLELTPIPLWSSLKLKTFPLDLGDSVNLEQLSIDSGQLSCSGRLEIRP